MRAEVICPFFDLEKGDFATPENTYHVGDVFEGTAARINGLAEKGFVRKLPQRKRTAARSKKE